MSTANDVATLLFTHMMIEKEIHDVWKQIQAVKEDTSLSPGLKSIELVRLFEVHNRLEVESTRQQEEYMKQFLISLNLEEIGAKPTIEGRLKCHFQQQVSPRTMSKSRTMSYGFYDSFSDKPELAKHAQLPRKSSDLILQQRSEIRGELAVLMHKRELSKGEDQRRKELANQLRSITD